MFERRLAANDAVYGALDAAEAETGEAPNADHPYEWGYSRLVLDSRGRLKNRIRRGLPWAKVRQQVAAALPPLGPDPPASHTADAPPETTCDAGEPSPGL